MWRAIRQAHWLSLSLLAGTTGCTISIQPWTRSGPAVPAHVDGAGPVGPPPGAVPPPNALPRTAPPVNMPNEQISQLIKMYNENDDHRKALMEQVSQLTRQVKDRDEGLRRASFEIEDSTKQIKRAKDDLRQWQGEVEDLRDRMKKLEEERAALKPLIEDILTELDRKKDAAPKYRGSGSSIGPSLR